MCRDWRVCAYSKGTSHGDATTVGIDLAKNVFSLHGVDAAGTVVVQSSVRPTKLLELIAQLPRYLIGMLRTLTRREWAQRGATVPSAT